MSEIENLFLVEEVLTFIAEGVLLSDPNARVADAKKKVLQELQASNERVAASLVASEAAMALSRFTKKADSLAALEGTLTRL